MMQVYYNLTCYASCIMQIIHSILSVIA